MNLSEPKQVTFWIAVIVAVLGLIAFFVASLSGYAFWLVLIGFIILALGNTMQGL